MNVSARHKAVRAVVLLVGVAVGVFCLAAVAAYQRGAVKGTHANNKNASAASEGKSGEGIQIQSLHQNGEKIQKNSPNVILSEKRKSRMSNDLREVSQVLQQQRSRRVAKKSPKQNKNTKHNDDDDSHDTADAQEFRALRKAYGLDPSTEDDKVLVNVQAADCESAKLVRQRLEDLGMVGVARFRSVISGELPISALTAIEEDDDIVSVWSARWMKSEATPVLSDGFGAMEVPSDVQGKGWTIAVMSDSFNTLGGAAADIANKELPYVTVIGDLNRTASDEGRAMLQIVHDVAPQARLVFRSGFNGEAHFALGIQMLAGCPTGSEPNCVPSPYPAHVIVDDILYFGEPMFQDGMIAQSADVVNKAGVVYVSSAGNNARNAWDGKARLTGEFLPEGKWPGFEGGYPHDFTGQGNIYQHVKVMRSRIALVFQWEQPFRTACPPGKRCSGCQSDWDVYLFSDLNGQPDQLVAKGTINNYRGDAAEYLNYPNKEGARDFYIVLVMAQGSPQTTEGLKWVHAGQISVLTDNTNSPSLFGHANAEGAIAVAAASARTPTILEAFSSVGGTPILFTPNAEKIHTTRLRPDLTGPDGTQNSFFGGGNRFYGTSAAAPHIAAVVGLLLEANACLRNQPEIIREVLKRTSTDMRNPYDRTSTGGYDSATGAGFVNARLAVEMAKSVPCGVIELWYSALPNTHNVAEDLVMTLLVRGVGNGNGSVAVQWGANDTNVQSSVKMASNMQIVIPAAILQSVTSRVVRIDATIEGFGTAVANVVLGRAPAICEACGAGFDVLTPEPIDARGVIEVQMRPQMAQTAKQFQLGTTCGGVFVALTSVRMWTGMRVSVPIPLPCPNTTTEASLMAPSLDAAPALTLCVYGDAPTLKTCVTTEINVLNAAEFIDNLHANTKLFVETSLWRGDIVTTALALGQAVGREFNALRSLAVGAVRRKLQSGLYSVEAAGLTLALLSRGAEFEVLNGLFAVFDDLNARGDSLSPSTAENFLAALLHAHATAVDNIEVQTQIMKYVNQIIDATVHNIATQYDVGGKTLGVGCSNGQPKSPASCQFFVRVSVVRPDQLARGVSWWASMGGFVEGNQNAALDTEVLTSGLVVTYTSWKERRTETLKAHAMALNNGSEEKPNEGEDQSSSSSSSSSLSSLSRSDDGESSEDEDESGESGDGEAHGSGHANADGHANANVGLDEYSVPSVSVSRVELTGIVATQFKKLSMGGPIVVHGDPAGVVAVNVEGFTDIADVVSSYVCVVGDAVADQWPQPESAPTADSALSNAVKCASSVVDGRWITLLTRS